MQNRCANMLMLYRFTVSTVIADFWADITSNLVVGAFPLLFNYLHPEPCGDFAMWVVQHCRTKWTREVPRWLPSRGPICFGRKLARCPPHRLALQDRSRSCGDGRVGKLARCGSGIGSFRPRHLSKSARHQRHRPPPLRLTCLVKSSEPASQRPTAPRSLHERKRKFVGGSVWPKCRGVEWSATSRNPLLRKHCFLIEQPNLVSDDFIVRQ